MAEDSPGTEPGVLRADVVIVGSGLAGLVAARECARIGARVLVTSGLPPLVVDGESDESTPAPADAATDSATSATVVPPEADDLHAEEFAGDGAMAALVADLGLGDLMRAQTQDEWWLKSGADVMPAPQATLAGIPASPLATDVARVVGRRGALRAYLDRLRPILTIGRETNLGALVRGRLGSEVWQRLVAPIVAADLGDDPETVLVGAASPALNAAMTRQGSLSGGVTEILSAAPGTRSRAVLDAGLLPVTDALASRVRFLGGSLRPDLGVVAVDEITDSTAVDRWRVHLADGSQIEARAVILAVDRARARSLAGNLLGAAWRGWPESHRDEVTTLVVDAPELDGAPRGRGVVALSDRTSQVLHHLTARRAGTRHCLRLITRTFMPRTGEADEVQGEITPDDVHWPRPARVLDAAEAATACDRVAGILGIELQTDSVVSAISERRLHPPSPAAEGQWARIESFQVAVEAHPGIAVSGDWLSGTGLDAKVAHAEAAASGIRGVLVRSGFHPSL